MAVRTGFEPAVGDETYNGLANRRFRPLSHLTFQIGFMNRSQEIATSRPANRGALLVAIFIMMVMAFGASGCASRGTSQANGLKEVGGAVQEPVVVGKIVQIDQSYGFVIIDSGGIAGFVAGQELEARRDNKKVAKLRVGPEALRPFIAADVVEGAPERGDLVFR